MRQTVTFDFYFPDIGGALTQIWQVTATHVYIEHPAFDIIGDPVNLPDIEEHIEGIDVNEITGGSFCMLVPWSYISSELRVRIIEQGKEIGRAQLNKFFKTKTI
jgi:hypothetical protein